MKSYVTLDLEQQILPALDLQIKKDTEADSGSNSYVITSITLQPQSEADLCGRDCTNIITYDINTIKLI